MEIQDVINGLLKLKKSYMQPQGCSVTTQNDNTEKVKLIDCALVHLKQYQSQVKA